MCSETRIRMIILYDNVVGKCLLDFITVLTVFSLVTGLSYIFIIVLLKELTVCPYRFTSLLYVHGFIMMSQLLKGIDSV